MSETAWENRMQWREEKRRGFDIEIKTTCLAPVGFGCTEHKCKKEAWRLYTVGQTDQKGGIEIGVCNDHDDVDRVIELYREERED